MSKHILFFNISEICFDRWLIRVDPLLSFQPCRIEHDLSLDSWVQQNRKAEHERNIKLVPTWIKQLYRSSFQGSRNVQLNYRAAVPDCSGLDENTDNGMSLWCIPLNRNNNRFKWGKLTCILNVMLCYNIFSKPQFFILMKTYRMNRIGLLLQI